MKRDIFWFILILLICITLSAGAETHGDTVTITFAITDNSQNAISARVGMEFDSSVFEFVSAEVISTDVLNTKPRTENGCFGLLNMSGISTGDIGSITLCIKADAPAGQYEVNPVVDSVYDANLEIVELIVEGTTITVEHAWDDGRVTVEATCYTEGAMTYHCSYCGEKRTETIPVTEHREGAAIVTKVATCTEDGVQIYPCDICHDTLREESIPAFGHADGETAVTQEPTCDAEGTQSVQCANCGKTMRTETIGATGHREVIVPGKDATWTEEGLTEGSCCDACDAVLVAQETIPAIGPNVKVNHGNCGIKCGTKLRFTSGCGYSWTANGTEYVCDGACYGLRGEAGALRDPVQIVRPCLLGGQQLPQRIDEHGGGLRFGQIGSLICRALQDGCHRQLPDGFRLGAGDGLHRCEVAHGHVKPQQQERRIFG